MVSKVNAQIYSSAMYWDLISMRISIPKNVQSVFTTFWLAILNIDNRTLPFQTLVVSIFVPEGNFAFPTVGDS